MILAPTRPDGNKGASPLTPWLFVRSTAQRAQELERRVATGTDAVVSQAQKLADAGLEKAKADLRKAYEAGDTEQFLTAQDAYTRATLEVERLKTYKPQAQKNLLS